jgi:flagellar basal-body rod protein FlgC
MTNVAGIALTGMTAATLKLGASASNLANIDDIAPVGAVGYAPVGVQATSLLGGGVSATAVTLKPPSFLAYAPTSPVANVQGMVEKPEIDPISEVGNQIQAGQAYAFQLKSLQVDDETEQSLLDMVA